MELPDNIYARINELSEKGNLEMDADNASAAIRAWEEALALLPPPASEWEAYTWLSASLGDAYFLSAQLAMAYEHFMNALNGPEGISNPFILYRIGQCLDMQGNQASAVEYLLRAYALDGEDIFDADDHGQAYLGMLRENGLI
jgi:tetratricopeptide (TPR) repeat protein